MTCPSCGSPRVFPSRLRTLLERLRSRLTDEQPLRCHECSWRAWRPIEVSPALADVQPDDLRTGRAPAPVSSQDLDPLDPQQPPRPE